MNGGFGGMIIGRPRRRPGAARKRVLERSQVFTLAESLGGVESLIEPPGHHDPRLDPEGGARGAAA